MQILIRFQSDNVVYNDHSPQHIIYFNSKIITKNYFIYKVN
jgi:hypothetical protein